MSSRTGKIFSLLKKRNSDDCCEGVSTKHCNQAAVKEGLSDQINLALLSQTHTSSELNSLSADVCAIPKENVIPGFSGALQNIADEHVQKNGVKVAQASINTNLSLDKNMPAIFPKDETENLGDSFKDTNINESQKTDKELSMKSINYCFDPITDKNTTKECGNCSSSFMLDQQNLEEMKDNEITNKPSGSLSLNQTAKEYHITGDTIFQEPLHKTPERVQEFSDFDSDDETADPTFLNTDEECENISEEEPENTKGKKRKKDPKTWRKNVKKLKMHAGLEYRTAAKAIKAKRVRSPCADSCKLKCKERISEEKRKIILHQFWSPRKTLETRRQFIASHVEQIIINRTRERTGERRGQRKHMNKYHLEVNGIRQTVCKIFFLDTLSISHQTVDTAILKKKEGGIVTPDKRGKHIPANKISEEIRNSVRSHISKFPGYESHYSREKTKRKYLGNHLNISRMYGLYLEDCQTNGILKENTAKEWLYAEIFNYEFNYAFKNPDNDTCDICDKFKLQLQEASQDLRHTLQDNYDQHLRDANNRYKLKSQDKSRSRLSNNLEKVIMIDLQKCLPTPDLHNSQSFYSLKLWTYNLTINDATAQNSFCVMSDESISGRGGIEIASCIIKWVESEIGNNVQELTIWSDNCPSQNRNLMLVMCYFWIVNIKPEIKLINHKFLARGDTHLEADADHAMIERERKKLTQFQVMTPWDWQQVVRLCGCKKKLNVINMDVGDFKDFKQLYEGSTAPFISKKKSDDGTDFYISNAVHLQTRRENPGFLFYKTKFDDNFSVIDLNRKTRRSSLMPISLPHIRIGPKPISTKKYEHLQKLLQWVPNRFHDFYKNIQHGAEEPD